MNNVVENISKRSRDEILNKVAKAHNIENFQRVETIDPVSHIKFSSDLIETIKENMQNNKFIVHDVTEKDVIDTINTISKENDCKSLLYPENLGIDLDFIEADEKICFNKDIEEIHDKVFHSDFSIINVFKGVASHGVACVVSSKEQPRMLSLALPLCIMLLKKENVVKSLVDALHCVKESTDKLPTNILFIAGPSRTSDIELITVFGVHGSQKVHIILY